MGKLLIEAKEKLEHGLFTTMIKSKLPFGPRTAEMLMRIAENPILSNPKYSSDLPPMWFSLYRLSQMTEQDLEFLLDRASIRADMTCKQVEELVEEFGVLKFNQVGQAIATLMKFVDNYPEPEEIAEQVLPEIDKQKIILKHIPDLSKWLNLLTDACDGKRKNAGTLFLAGVETQPKKSQTPKQQRRNQVNADRLADLNEGVGV